MATSPIGDWQTTDTCVLTCGCVNIVMLCSNIIHMCLVLPISTFARFHVCNLCREQTSLEATVFSTCVGGCGFTHEKIRLGTSYRFSYPRHQDFGAPIRLQSVIMMSSIEFERATYNMKRSRQNACEGREDVHDVRKNTNTRATVASCVCSTVVQGMFTTATHSAIYEY